ncbi:hypothetical protein EVAR_25377_1 [Eumeta japonica]|uniref:Uncharacterized protein n=1 Tax=Eumeta variegata TaxID=151549 RepID=A0A4C1V5X6_EUMVA|nr:hypothetical protein EVAR_25377_1 [Eumeta japonica]
MLNGSIELLAHGKTDPKGGRSSRLFLSSSPFAVDYIECDDISGHILMRTRLSMIRGPSSIREKLTPNGRHLFASYSILYIHRSHAVANSAAASKMGRRDR